MSLDYQEAAMWIRKTPAPENAIYHFIAAAVLAEGGFAADAERERVWLMANVPAMVQNVREELAARNYRPEDAERLINSWKRAGLPIPD